MNKKLRLLIEVIQKLRIKKTYWSIAVPLFLFLFTELVKTSEVLINLIELSSNEIDNKIIKKILELIVLYLKIDISLFVTIPLLVLFIVITRIKYLEVKKPIFNTVKKYRSEYKDGYIYSGFLFNGHPKIKRSGKHGREQIAKGVKNLENDWKNKTGLEYVDED